MKGPGASGSSSSKKKRRQTGEGSQEGLPAQDPTGVSGGLGLTVPSWGLCPSCLKPPAQWLRWVWGQGTLPTSWQLSQQLRNGFTEE